MRSKGGGVIDLRPRSWQTAWGYLELEGAVTGKSLRSVSPFWILTLPGFPRPVTAEGETGAVIVQGSVGRSGRPSEDGMDVSSKPEIGQHLFTPASTC